VATLTEALAGFDSDTYVFLAALFTTEATVVERCVELLARLEGKYLEDRREVCRSAEAAGFAILDRGVADEKKVM